MSYETISVEVDKICRTCLCVENNLQSIFSANNGQIRLFEMLMSCASVQVINGIQFTCIYFH